MKLFRIGRAPENEMQLSDASVSRRHAELVRTASGKLFLLDCESMGGTFVFKDADWRKVRQIYVDPDDEVRFGKVTLSIRSILSY